MRNIFAPHPARLSFAMPEEKNELLELYKLHSKLADRVSQRREGVNRLYAALLTGVLVAILAFASWGGGETTILPVWSLGLFGITMCVAWYINIRSYQQLNEGKFHALDKLEEKLAFHFFKVEWEFLKKGESRNKYWKLTDVEKFLPGVFGLVFLLVILFTL